MNIGKYSAEQKWKITCAISWFMVKLLQNCMKGLFFVTVYKHAILLTSLLAALLLVSCCKIDPPVTTDMPITTETYEDAELPLTTEVPATTELLVTTTVPVTTTLPKTNIAPSEPVVVPEIVIAEEYAKDSLGYGDYYQHLIQYPKILSDAPGAAALNQRFRESYGHIIKILKADAEKDALYNISFSSSTYDGIICIRIAETTGTIVDSGSRMDGIWVDETCNEKIIYYNAATDQEMTLEEYIAHFGIDLEKAKIGVLGSFEIENREVGKGSAFASETIGGEPIFPLESNRLYFLQYPSLNDTVSLYGIDVTSSTLCLYYAEDSLYGHLSFCCPLQRDTYAPVHPNYTCTVRIPEDAKESDSIEIAFTDGRVSDIAAPSIYKIDVVEITAKKLLLKVYKKATNDYSPLFPQENESLIAYDITPYYDGTNPHTTGFGSRTNNEYSLGLRIYEYMPIDTLKKLTITIQEKQ